MMRIFVGFLLMVNSTAALAGCMAPSPIKGKFRLLSSSPIRFQCWERTQKNTSQYFDSNLVTAKVESTKGKILDVVMSKNEAVQMKQGLVDGAYEGACCENVLYDTICDADGTPKKPDVKDDKLVGACVKARLSYVFTVIRPQK